MEGWREHVHPEDLKLLEVDPDVKVIVSSGYATDPIMSDYKKYGFSDVVTKPYRVGQLSNVVRSVLKGKDTS